MHVASSLSAAECRRIRHRHAIGIDERLVQARGKRSSAIGGDGCRGVRR